MRRAVSILVPTIAATLCFAPSFADEPAPHQAVERPPDVIDGAGLVNYMQHPDFKVGTWLTYRTVSSSLRGYKDDYTVTILIGGEEVWWGEPCFWIETHTKKADSDRVTASLVSYAAFGDTMSDNHILWFMRKTIDGFKDVETQTPDISLYTRSKSEVQLRRAQWAKDENAPRTDSLGADTVSVPAGNYDTFQVRKHYGLAQTAEQGDSTIYYERMLDRTFHLSHKIPVTNLARVDIDDTQRGKTWLAGKFERGALNVLERAQGKTELIAFGTTGVTPLLVPKEARHSIDRKLIEALLAEPLEPGTAASRRRTGQ